MNTNTDETSEKPKRSGWIVGTSILLAVAVLYPLSCGPAYWSLVKLKRSGWEMRTPEMIVDCFYSPVEWIAGLHPVSRQLFISYKARWGMYRWEGKDGKI